MKGVVAWALGVAVVACGGADRSAIKPGLTPLARELADSVPREGARVGASSCTGSAQCRDACDTGDVNACTRLGDVVFVRDERAAQQLWLWACQRSDGDACARLAQTTSEDRRIANRFAEHACAYGHFESCSLLASELEVRARVSWGEDAAELRRRARRYAARARDLATALAPVDPPEPATTKPADEPPTVTRAERIRGTTAIAPTEQSVRAMREAGTAHLFAALKVCVTRIGTVGSVRFLERSASPVWDLRIFAAVRGWRYRPFAINGVSVGTCASVNFRYRDRTPR